MTVILGGMTTIEGVSLRSGARAPSPPEAGAGEARSLDVRDGMLQIRHAGDAIPACEAQPGRRATTSPSALSSADTAAIALAPTVTAELILPALSTRTADGVPVAPRSLPTENAGSSRTVRVLGLQTRVPKSASTTAPTPVGLRMRLISVKASNGLLR